MDINVDEKLSGDELLWRYMDLAKFVSLLDTKSIWLARSDTFRDRREGHFPDEMRKRIEQAYKGFDDAPSPVKDAEDFQDYLVKNTFISCWHKNFDENMVMWEIYGKDNNAVAVQTTVDSLKNNTDTSGLVGHSLILQDVIYENSEDEQGNLLYEQCFFRKRKHFSFEKEVRLSLDTYNRSAPTKGNQVGYSVPINSDAVINKIFVHPDSSGWYIKAVESIAKKYCISAPVEKGKCGNT
tara:strand:+ start:66 stop:782 length:717 start_codon:yes stop_codon:yes gene_type:complete